MKVFSTLAVLIIVATLVACSDDRRTEATITAKDGVSGSSCSVAPEYSQDVFGEYQRTSVEQIGARISCTDGSFAIILNGQNGEQGSSCSASRQSQEDRVKIQCGNQPAVYIYDGDDGSNGVSCSATQLSNGARITCGNSVALIYNGEQGSTGQAGSSCAVSNLSNGVRITCGNSSQDLFDGQNGRDSALMNAIGIASYIKPCGSEFANDEIFLRMTDGNILALYDGGPHEDRLVLLAPGNYITTDRNKNNTCHFTVTSDLKIINEQVR